MMKKFKVVLSSFGKLIYKDGNIPVMKKHLKWIIEAKTEYKAENIFAQKMGETLGSASISNYKLKEVV
jgi:hypothetical protein